MASDRISRFLYKWGWDTRCRGLDTVRALDGLVGPKTTVLDAGCGEYGISTFLRAAKITGSDILPAEEIRGEMKYVPGSIIDLPFEDREFDIVLAIDVLEHLPDHLREQAVSELVRVASKAVLMTYPSTPGGRAVDEDFATGLLSRGQETPEWLAEHLAGPYPDTRALVEYLQQRSKRTIESVVAIPSERLNNARLVRWGALKSPSLFLATSVITGLMYRFVPRPNERNAYRTILLARFAPDAP
jgi:SAM-dependent methyltransferase